MWLTYQTRWLERTLRKEGIVVQALVLSAKMRRSKKMVTYEFVDEYTGKTHQRTGVLNHQAKLPKEGATVEVVYLRRHPNMSRFVFDRAFDTPISRVEE